MSKLMDEFNKCDSEADFVRKFLEKTNDNHKRLCELRDNLLELRGVAATTTGWFTLAADTRIGDALTAIEHARQCLDSLPENLTPPSK